jgi:hypothetical protein
MIQPGSNIIINEPIQYEDNPNQYKQITDQKEIEDHLLKRNIVHFGQAKDTPFAQG